MCAGRLCTSLSAEKSEKQMILCQSDMLSKEGRKDERKDERKEG